MVTREDVKKRLKKLNGNKAPGPDGVSPLVLKESSDALCSPLSDIFRASLDTGLVRSDWRKANIFPIFKRAAE